MKNLLFTIIFVLLAGSLWAQQQTDVLQHKEHRMHNDPLMEQYANPDQDPMFSGELDFLPSNMKNTELDILVDSIIFIGGYGEFNRIYTYDENRNILTYVQKYWCSPSIIPLGTESDTYTYDINGNILTVLHKIWSVDVLSSTRLFTYTYDNNGNMLSKLYQKLENDEWANSFLKTYTYDENDNKMTELFQEWENDEWLNTRLYSYTYNTNGDMLAELEQIFENNTWKNYSIDTFTYNTEGNVQTFLWQKWENEEWKNKQSNSYTYDNHGNIINKYSYYWESGEWINSSLSSYTYDQNSNILTRLYQKCQNDFLVNDGLYYYTNDDYGNRLTELSHRWINSSWEINRYCVYDFQPGNASGFSYYWDGDKWETGCEGDINIVMEGELMFDYHADTIEFYYTDFSGIEAPKKNPENSPILCYPNPVTDQINLEIDPAWQAKNYQLELFSQTGQKVKSFEVSSNIGSTIAPIKVDDVPSGLYLLRIEAGKQNFSQKIIISK
jgi:hypothetical protein